MTAGFVDHVYMYHYNATITKSYATPRPRPPHDPLRFPQGWCYSGQALNAALMWPRLRLEWSAAAVAESMPPH